MKLHKVIILALLIPQAALAAVKDIQPPQVVGVPPADAGRGLVRASETEIRHYSGGEGYDGRKILVSHDNGRTWQDSLASSSYPPNFEGLRLSHQPSSLTL